MLSRGGACCSCHGCGAVVAAGAYRLKLFDTVTELPLKGGTVALRNTEAMQPPTDVPP